jgi:hypothetical protein
MRFALFILTLIVAFNMPLNSQAYEVDQFTNRDEKPKDSTEILDKEIQRRLEEAVKKANSGFFGFNCNGDAKAKKESRLKLFTELESQLTNKKVTGVLERFANNNKSVSKRLIPFSDSVYKSAKKYSKVLNTAETTGVITINNVQIGTDKLGHFFDQGHTVYLSNYNALTEKQKYISGLRDSVDAEDDEYGVWTTGVYSYADIAANHGGHKFWEKLCGFTYSDTKEEDRKHIETYRCHKEAYIQCDPKTGNWILNPTQKFTLKDYVTDAWDESINCNLYASDASDLITNEMTRKVHAYKGNPKQPCPAEPKKCIEFQKYYQRWEMTNYVTSPICKQIIAAAEEHTPISKKEKFSYDLEYHRSRKTSVYGSSATIYETRNVKKSKGSGKR